MCACVYIYVYVGPAKRVRRNGRAAVQMHYVCVYRFVCKYVYIHMRMCVHIYICRIRKSFLGRGQRHTGAMYVCLYLFVCMYTCAHLCTYVHMWNLQNMFEGRGGQRRELAL